MYWELKNIPPKETTNHLMQELNVSSVVANLLAQRNISTFSEAKTFFRPELGMLHDPFLMQDMLIATERVVQAINQNQKILIYGDYDVDGSVSVAMCYDFFKKFTNTIFYYIPDRYTEGYGVSDKGIDYAIAQKVDLVITVDCGIKAIEKIKRAKDAGIDFIICDHHNPDENLPEAVAVLDPKRKDCLYPFKELCGCGVAFKLIQAFCKMQGLSNSCWINLLEFVAIATAADIVPVTGENRVLIFEGLKQLNDSKRPGIAAIIELTGYQKPLTTHHIVFGIAPRINAAGRIDHAHGAVALLLSKNEEQAQEWSKKIGELNEKRRGLDQDITQSALTMIAQQEQEYASTVLHHADWHKGVIGIVASRCIEHYYRPTIIFCENENSLTGSARSVAGFDIYEAIKACSEHIEQFGGHKYAAGLTVSKHKFADFKLRFEEEVQKRILPQQKQQTIDIDLAINLKDITPSLQRIVSQMEPFGPENHKPVFMLSAPQVVKNSVRILKEHHLKFSVEENNCRIDAIAFNMADKHSLLDNPCKICFTIDLNTYQGVSSIQLMVRDIVNE